MRHGADRRAMLGEGLHASLISIRDAARLERIVLAVKTAAAAAVAWLLAPYVPYADSDYSYYAPLGVLVSMHPTLLSSARAGAQSLSGLAIGVLLGLGGMAVVRAGVPGVAVLAVVIAAGVLIGGLRVLGGGGEWVAIAALIVLLLGGIDADGFSLSYLLTMAFGVVVGVLVNLIGMPPLHLSRAGRRLSDLRRDVHDALRALADAAEQGEREPDRFREAVGRLSTAREETAATVGLAEESVRGNPRARRRRGERDLARRRMDALQRSTELTLEIADLLLTTPEHPIAARDAAPLVRALHAAAELVATAPDDADTDRRIREASEEARMLREHLAGASAGYAPHLVAVSICIERIAAASRPFAPEP